MKKNEDERKKIQKYVIKLFTDGFISGILRETEYAVTNPAQYARPSLSVLQAGFRGILHLRKSFGGQAATTNRPARRSPKGEVGDDKEKFFIFNLSLLILKRSLQITTAIPYMTGHVHIGNTMDHILADILVRYHRMRGEEVQFLAGSDEHGVKVYNKAKELRKTPIQMLDENVDLYKDALEKLDIHPDDFIRTTDQKRHWPVAQEVWRRMAKKGDIYKKSYTGLYCEGCEVFLTDKDMDEDGNCVHHHKPPKEVEEENYFFKLSAYEDFLRDKISSDEIHIHPDFRKNEMLAFIDQGLEDVSFSRQRKTMPWGIPVPDDDEHVMYVWCDALTNYLTGAGFLRDDELFEKYGQAFVHIIGKDISRFHCLFYQAMLESADLPVSRNLLVHGFVMSGGHRLSKTLGNALDPIEMSEKYGSDAVKFFIGTAVGVGKDIDYTEEWFHAVYTDQLANNYGNYVNRSITLFLKSFPDGIDTQKLEYRFGGELRSVYERYKKSMESFDIREASAHAMGVLDTANKFMNECEPWKIEDEKEKAWTLLSTLEYLYHVTVLLSPLLPNATKKVFQALGVDDISLEPEFRYTQTNFSLSKPDILFERVEYFPPDKQEKELTITVNPELEKMVVYARVQIPNNPKKQGKPLQKYLTQRFENFDLQAIRDSDTIKGYYEHFEERGLTDQHPASINLINLFEKNGKLPNISRLVDTYNITSLTTGLSFGVHDVDKLPDHVEITLAQGGEDFDAIGGVELIGIQTGEFVLKGSDRVYGRDIKQSEQSKITEDTRDVLIYVQGNINTTKQQLQDALDEVLRNIDTFLTN